MSTNRPGYMREYQRRERNKIIQKLGGKCQKCGVSVKTRTVDGIVVDNMEIHHKNGTALKSRGRGSTRRLTDWKRNIDKLGLHCKKCHERGKRPTNG